MKQQYETIPMFIHGVTFTISNVHIIHFRNGKICEQMTLTENGWVYINSPNHQVKIDHDDFDHIMIGWSKTFDEADRGLCTMTVITKSSTVTYTS